MKIRQVCSWKTERSKHWAGEFPLKWNRHWFYLLVRLVFLLLFFSSCHTYINLELIWTLLQTFSCTFYILSRFHLLLRSLYTDWRLPLAIQHWHFLRKYWCHMVIQKVSTPHLLSANGTLFSRCLYLKCAVRLLISSGDYRRGRDVQSFKSCLLPCRQLLFSHPLTRSLA